MKTNILTLVITLVIGVIMTGAVLAPVVNDATDALTVTKTNDFGTYASAMDEDLTISIKVNETDNTKWDFTVNGVTINYPVDTRIANPVLLTDTMQIMLSESIIIASYTNARFTGQTEFNATLSNDLLNATSTNGTTPHTWTDVPYSWAFYAAETGDYRVLYLLSNENETIYYTDLNDVYGSNFVFTTNKFYSFHGDSVTYYATGTTPTTINANVEATTVNGTLDMYSFDVSRNVGGYTFQVDNAGTEYTVHPWVYIVPEKVSSDAIENKDQISALFGVIPILVIVAILMTAVGAIALRRAD